MSLSKLTNACRRTARRGLAMAAVAMGLAALPWAANAALLTYEDIGKFDHGGYKERIELDRFDPAKGRLISVTVSASLSGSGVLGIANTFKEDLSGKVDFKLGDVRLLLDAYNSCYSTCPPNFSFPISDSKSSTSTAVDTLALFTGPPSTFLIEFSIDALGVYVTSFMGEAKVTYSYETDAGTVPEPASLSLAALALAGLAGTRLRRRA